MTISWPGWLIPIAAAGLLAANAATTRARDLPLDLIQLPPGFSIDVFAEDVPNARQMALGGYETWRSSWSFLEVDSAKRVIETLENLMK